MKSAEGAMLARCGFRCDLCPAFKDNVTGPEHQQWVSDGWFKYYGFRIPADRIRCDGCRAEDSTCPNRIDVDCPVRPCVIDKGLDSCAQCDGYVCPRLSQRLVDGAEVSAKMARPIPPQELDAFIRAYDNKRRLEQIRRNAGRQGATGGGQAGRDSREGGCEKGFSHQRKSEQ